MTITHAAARKIIHIDMDCFYAAIEIRDNPALANKPVAVGGTAKERGVLCTCNYIARKFKVRSALATAYALRLCPDLIVLPVNMKKYRETAQIIQQIFHEYTPLVEPLSLDEAYLDVSNSEHCHGSATLIAQEIRQKIWDAVQLTASAGVASNKFLAKIASGWKKPNGLFVIRPQEIESFVKHLSVEKIYGVGKVTAKKLHAQGLKDCTDLQKLSLTYLTENFGKLGSQLYERCRGIDNRAVEPNRVRKSLSIERTFSQDIYLAEKGESILLELHHLLTKRIVDNAANLRIKNQYVKIKSSDFKLYTLEKSSHTANLSEYQNLLQEIARKQYGTVRLLGLGVHFSNEDELPPIYTQQSLI